ncbi:unnamed protein product, partial [Amoebophrya sp. A25]
VKAGAIAAKLAALAVFEAQALEVKARRLDSLSLRRNAARTTDATKAEPVDEKQECEGDTIDKSDQLPSAPANPCVEVALLLEVQRQEYAVLLQEGVEVGGAAHSWTATYNELYPKAEKQSWESVFSSEATRNEQE